MSKPDSPNQPPPRLDSEQCQRASLIAESRGIDDDTAFELVYLRDRSAALQAELDAPMLTRPNGSFVPTVYEQILIAGKCGVAGHFRFQENGSSCLMCQREAQQVEAFRQRAVAAVRAKGEEFRQTADRWQQRAEREEGPFREQSLTDRDYCLMKADASFTYAELLQQLPATEQSKEPHHARDDR